MGYSTKQRTFNRQTSKGRKILKKILNILSQIQAKTTPRFHFTSLIMAKIKNTITSLCWRGCGLKGTVLH